jgi:hypothetical protein
MLGFCPALSVPIWERKSGRVPDPAKVTEMSTTGGGWEAEKKWKFKFA